MDASLVGRHFPAQTMSITRELIERYARATGDTNPRYYGPAAIAPPLMVVAASIPKGVLPVVTDTRVIGDTARLLKLLHGEEEIRWEAAIRAGDTLSTFGWVVSSEDKSSGELLTVGTQIDNQRGEHVAKTVSALVIRDKRVASLKQAKEELARREEPRAEEFSLSWTVDADQSERYAEASGDRNPIHLDDALAVKAGLRGKILHGLCTMAFAQRAAIECAAGGDPLRLKALRVRFTKPVYMLDTLTCVGWTIAETPEKRTLGLEVRNQDGVVVLRDGVAEVG